MDNNLRQNVQSDMKKRIEKQLKGSGLSVNLSNFNVDFDEETRAKFPGLSDTEIFDKLDDAERDRLARELVEEIEIDSLEMGAQQPYEFDTVEKANYIKEFRNNPCEKTLLALKKSTVNNWKRFYKIANENTKAIINNPTYNFSSEELKGMLAFIDLCFDLDLNLIKSNESIGIILNSNIVEESSNFCATLLKFSEDIIAYEGAFRHLQMHTANIDEFEEKMKNFLVALKTKNNGKTLTDIDNQIFKDKKDLEQEYKEVLSAYKKSIEHMQKAQKCKNEYIKQSEEGKKSYLQEFYEITYPRFSIDKIDSDLELFNKYQQDLKQREKVFQSFCDKQLSLKMHLKDLNREIENYIKVSREQNDGRQA